MKNEFDWSPWSACTKTCGVGSYRTRERTCSLSIPEDLRKVCIGSDIQKVPCIVPMCSKTPAVIPNDIPQQGSAMKTSEFGYRNIFSFTGRVFGLLTYEDNYCQGHCAVIKIKKIIIIIIMMKIMIMMMIMVMTVLGTHFSSLNAFKIKQ